MNRIAIILPVYKKDKVNYLHLAVESIIMQTFGNYHLYIGVDGPVGKEIDDFLKVIDRQSTITIVRFNENRGLACVLNDLLEICFKEGYEYIARMDADDISEPARLELQLDFLIKHPDIDVISGGVTEIDDEGKSRNKRVILPQSHDDCYKFFATRNPLAHPAVMFRKSFFDKAGVYDPSYKRNQDTILWWHGLKNGCRFGNVQEIILKFRVTDAMLSSRRGGYEYAKRTFKDRMVINKELGYGPKAFLFAVFMFLFTISPLWVKKLAYKTR
jgi:glycosyltransferase involved in cell wall biosynthesis